MKEKIEAGIAGLAGGSIIAIGISDLLNLIKPFGVPLLGAIVGFIICYKAEQKRHL